MCIPKIPKNIPCIDYDILTRSSPNEDYETTFFKKKKELLVIQKQIAKYVKKCYYRELYAPNEKIILNMKYFPNLIPDNIRNSDDPLIEKRMKEIKNIWDQMNRIGLKIRSLE